jgi:hypothetical protein
MKSRGRPTGTSGRDVPRPSGRVQPPSSRYQTYTEGNVFRVAVPSNWRELPGSNTVTFAPEGAYGQGIFTHGVEIGVARAQTSDLQDATDALLQSLAQGNPNLRRANDYERITLGGRRGLRTVVTNTSSDGRRETIQVYSTQMRNGNLFYAIGVSPSEEFGTYRDVFDRVAGSIRLND